MLTKKRRGERKIDVELDLGLTKGVNVQNRKTKNEEEIKGKKKGKDKLETGKMSSEEIEMADSNDSGRSLPFLISLLNN
jgi:hypothetical protein